MADLDPGLVAVLIVAVVFLAWYYAAFVYSRRLAGRIASELKNAIVGLGGTSHIRWFGTNAFRMTTEGANPPFREVSVTVTLRPREMPINWAIATVQGRRDAALVEASLRKDPGVHFEVVDPHTRIGARRGRAKSDWERIHLGEREWLLNADAGRTARRILSDLPAETFETIVALHVTSGSQPGIAASLSVEPDRAGRGLEAIRALAARLAV